MLNRTALSTIDTPTAGTYTVQASGNVPPTAMVSVGGVVDFGLIAAWTGTIALFVGSLLLLVVTLTAAAMEAAGRSFRSGSESGVNSFAIWAVVRLRLWRPASAGGTAAPAAAVRGRRMWTEYVRLAAELRGGTLPTSLELRELDKVPTGRPVNSRTAWLTLVALSGAIRRR